MADLIDIRVDDREVLRHLDRLAAKAADLSPVMREISFDMLDAVHRNFEDGGRPNPWKRSQRAARDGGRTLQDTNRLYRSIAPRSDANSAAVGTNVVYAKYLQFGTRAHTVVPRRAKALRIPGVGFRKKADIPAMPARPFLVLTDDDTRKIVERMKRYLATGD